MQSLPFFDDSHRKTAGQLDRLVRESVSPLAQHDEAKTERTARRYVQVLSDAGWLKRIDPADIRTACLIRERLAYASSLADTMFAMQGLGGLPIAMYGTPRQQREWFGRIQ